MQDAAMAMMKPGVHWEDVHLLMHRMIIKGLLEMGILIQGPAKETGKALEDKLFDMNMSVPFLPHGLVSSALLFLIPANLE